MNDEKVRLITEIETDEAARNLEVLKTELSEVNKELRSMGKYSEEWTEEQKKQYHDLRAEQKELKEEVKDYTRAIDLNDASMNELVARSRQLQNELRQLKVGSDEWIDKLGEIQHVNTRLHDVREEMDHLGGAVQKQSDYWKQFRDDFAATFLAVNLTDVIQEIIQFGTESVEMAAEVTDAFADIQKTTGMTADEVVALNDRLQEIDTRTAQEALLEIAKVGGQIGIAGDQMDGFVASVDKAVVALGDEFKGGAEEVAETMGILSKLFKDTKELEAGDAINQIGSAINELGSAGSATGPVIADFAMRMGQLGDLSPQIAETMGLGAAFQELGLSAEISAGGLSNILLSAAKDTAAFADQIGITDAEFKNLINTNPNEVILQLAKSFQGLPTDVVVKQLADLGIKSQEATKVMSLLSTQTDDVRKKQELASKAMKDGTSLTNEFNLKNKNAAAELDKAKKAVDALKVEMGTGLLPIVTKVIAGGVAFINTIRAIPSFINQNKTSIAALGVAMVTLNASNIKATASTLAHAAAEKGRLIWTQSVTAAQWLMNAAMTANPIGLVVAAIAVLIAGLTAWYNNSETLRAAVNGVWQVLKDVGSFLKSTLGPAVDYISERWKAFRAAISTVTDFLSDIFSPTMTKVGGAFDFVKGKIDVVKNAISSFISSISNVITGAVTALDKFTGGALSTALDYGKKIGESFSKGYQDKIKEESPKATAEHKKMLDKKASDSLAGGTKSGENFGSASGAAELSALDKTNSSKSSKNTAHNAEKLAAAKKAAEDEAAAKLATEAKTRIELEKMDAESIKDAKTRQLALLDFEYVQKVNATALEKMDEELKVKYIDALHRKLINDKSAVETQYRTEKETKDKALADKLAANDATLRQAETTAAFDAARAINDFELLAAGDNQKAIFAAKQTRLALERSAELIQLENLYNEKVKDLAKRKADDIRTAEEAGQETTSIKNRYLELERSATQEFNAKKLGLDTQYQKDQTALHQQESDARLAKTTDFFGGVKNLMDGDFSYFTNLLAKRKGAETAHENERLKQFSQKTDQIGKAALAGVDTLQKLNQKFLESQLARIDKERNKELSSWEQKYKKGLISKDEYEKGVAKINKDADDKQLAEKKKAFERDKKLQKAQALISGALAFIKALASGFFPLNLVFAAATAVATGLQVAAIGRQQFQAEKGIRTSASHFRNAGIMKGSRHGSRYGDSGISMVDRKTGLEIGEAEDGEAFMILSRNTVKNNGKLIDTLMHSSLHKNGAPVSKVQYRDGGIGSVGWSDYYTPTMMLFGSKKKKAAAAAEAAQAQAEAEAAAAEAEQEAADAMANYDTGGGGGDYDSDYTGESYSGDDGQAAIAENTKIARDTEGNTRSAAGSLKDIAGTLGRTNQLLEQIAGKPNPPGAGEIGGAVAGAIGSSLRSNM
jgi:TP901 family phage tail tape measure protein